jgi:hypothetical protein
VKTGEKMRKWVTMVEIGQKWAEIGKNERKRAGFFGDVQRRLTVGPSEVEDAKKRERTS